MKETIAQHKLLGRSDRVLVGLSGGPDSWALLLALHRIAADLAIHVQAACVDHGLRPESAAEAREVVARVRAMGLAASVLKVKIAGRKTGGSLQDAARRARLSALQAHAKKQRCNRIALGHNAQDQAETILFRIVRGTGLVGLRGIPYQRGPFIRPLLDVNRPEIARFVARAGVVPIQDPSNANARFARARVRHDWLPLLQKENPRLIEALLALGREASALTVLEPSGPVTAGRRGQGVYVHRDARKTVDKLIKRGGSHTVSVLGGTVQITYGQTSFRKSGPVDKPVAPIRPRTITRAGRFRVFPGGPELLVQRLRAAPRPDRASGAAAIFDANALAWPLVLRSWQPGDRMHPRGGPGRRKLQDLFTDAKVPRARRPMAAVVTDAHGRILFAAGLRPAETGRPGEETGLGCA